MTSERHFDSTLTEASALLRIKAAVALPWPKAVIALVVGATGSVLASQFNVQHAAPASVLLSFGLAWASAIDVNRLKLPDVLTMSLLTAGLIDAALAGALFEHVVGAMVGFFCLVSIAAIYRRIRGIEGIGRGDSKLLAAGGAWIGWVNLPMAILVASVSALPFALFRTCSNSMDKRIPFGPFIALGVFVCWLSMDATSSAGL